MQNNDIISVFKCAPNLNLDFSMLKSFKKSVYADILTQCPKIRGSTKKEKLSKCRSWCLFIESAAL